MPRIFLIFLCVVCLTLPAGFANAGESKKPLVFTPFKDYKRPPKKKTVDLPKPVPVAGKKIDTSKGIVVMPSTSAYIATPRRPKEPAAEDPALTSQGEGV